MDVNTEKTASYWLLSSNFQPRDAWQLQDAAALKSPMLSAMQPFACSSTAAASAYEAFQTLWKQEPELSSVRGRRTGDEPEVRR